MRPKTPLSGSLKKSVFLYEVGTKPISKVNVFKDPSVKFMASYCDSKYTGTNSVFSLNWTYVGVTVSV